MPISSVTIPKLAKLVGEKHRMSTRQVKEIIDTFVLEVTRALDEGEIVRLSGLGSLRVKLYEGGTRRAFGRVITVGMRQRVIFRGVHKVREG